MFKVILETQWKWVRLPLLVATVVAFTMPVLSVQRAGGLEMATVDALEVLVDMNMWAVWYPLLAAGVGLLVGVMAWGADHRQGHSYALSLPVPRWKFAGLRLAAAFVLLAAPVVALSAGSLLAASTATIPLGLTAYPVALSIRFALAASLSLTMFFAISAGSPRTAGYLLAGMAVILTGQYLMMLVGADSSTVASIFDRLTDWRGPLGIFGGRWMLIDV